MGIGNQSKALAESSSKRFFEEICWHVWVACIVCLLLFGGGERRGLRAPMYGWTGRLTHRVIHVLSCRILSVISSVSYYSNEFHIRSAMFDFEVSLKSNSGFSIMWHKKVIKQEKTKINVVDWRKCLHTHWHTHARARTHTETNTHKHTNKHTHWEWGLLKL
jgi:hypothetical protein